MDNKDSGESAGALTLDTRCAADEIDGDDG